MGLIWSSVKRPLKKFNIESRAQKVLSKDKPSPSPLYPKAQQELDLVKKEHPDFMEEQSKKDASLDDRLKQVYVQSMDEEKLRMPSSQSSRPLPISRKPFERPITGYLKPDEIPPGKCTLEDILNILTEYKADPVKKTVSNIATKYKLSEKTVGDILEYHMIFNLGMTKDVEEKLKNVKEPPKITM